MNKKNILILFILLVILGIGIFWYLSVYKEERGMTESVSMDINVYVGEVAAVNPDKITVKIIGATGLDMEMNYDLVDFQVNNKSRIYQETDKIKSQEEFNREQDEFNGKINEFKQQGKDIGDMAGIEAPSWRIRREVGLDDISAGRQASVFAYDHDNKKIVNKLVIKFTPKSLETAPAVNENLENIRLQGKIKAIQDRELSLLTGSAGVVNVVVNNKTEIIKKTQKTQEQFNREQVVFKQKIEQLPSGSPDIYKIEAPSWFTVEEIEFSRLTLGQEAIISAIKNKASGKVAAERIEIRYNANTAN